MRKVTGFVLCTSLILGGCSLMHKDQTKDIPKTVSVKDYDGQYIGEHKKKRSISEKHKGEAIKNIKTM